MADAQPPSEIASVIANFKWWWGLYSVPIGAVGLFIRWIVEAITGMSKTAVETLRATNAERAVEMRERNDRIRELERSMNDMRRDHSRDTDELNKKNAELSAKVHELRNLLQVLVSQMDRAGMKPEISTHALDEPGAD